MASASIKIEVMGLDAVRAAFAKLYLSQMAMQCHWIARDLHWWLRHTKGAPNADDLLLIESILGQIETLASRYTEPEP